MCRISFAAMLLPLLAGCCCCGGFTAPSHVPASQLVTVNSLNLNGPGDITVTVGSEPYSIDTESAPLSSSTIEGSDLSLFIMLGQSTASLPQLAQITIGETTAMDLQGVDVSDLTIVKVGLGAVVASGKVTNLEVDANGLCSVDLTELVAENVTVNITSDDTSVEVHATGKLIVNIDGNGSTVKYTGGAELTENITGSSTAINLDDPGSDDTTDGTNADAIDPNTDGEAVDGLEPAVLDGEGLGEIPDVTTLDGDAEFASPPSSAAPNAIGD